jgi:hypothetical protein
MRADLKSQQDCWRGWWVKHQPFHGIGELWSFSPTLSLEYRAPRPVYLYWIVKVVLKSTLKEREDLQITLLPDPTP